MFCLLPPRAPEERRLSHPDGSQVPSPRGHLCHHRAPPGPPPSAECRGGAVGEHLSEPSLALISWFLFTSPETVLPHRLQDQHALRRGAQSGQRHEAGEDPPGWAAPVSGRPGLPESHRCVAAPVARGLSWPLKQARPWPRPRPRVVCSPQRIPVVGSRNPGRLEAVSAVWEGRRDPCLGFSGFSRPHSRGPG